MVQSSTDIRQQDIRAGYIFCLGDPLDTVLRRLSPDYFAAAYQRLTTTFKSFNLDLPLRPGWMHPGYACPVLESDIPSMNEPAGLFGWVTQRTNGDLTEYESRLPEIIASLAEEVPAIQWAICSARLFRYLQVSENDFDTIHQLFIEFTLSEPSDWAISTVVPDDLAPTEPWRQVCFAIANGDSKLERKSWDIANKIYSESALDLLRKGTEFTRRGLTG